MSELTSSIVVSVFTVEQAERLTGVSAAQLREWDKKDFFTPSHAFKNRSNPYSRIYSFKDLVCLKIIGDLRNKAKVPLEELVKTKNKLAKFGNDMWAKTTLYVLNKKVVFQNPETKERESVVEGQRVFDIPLQIASGDMQKAIENLRQRDPETIGKIEKKRGVAHNQHVISGTRIPVSSIKVFINEGYTVEQVLQEYPSLEETDIDAAIKFVEAA